MTTLGYLIPVALLLGGLGLAAFVWALRSGQYDDLDGAAERILLDPAPETADEADVSARPSPRDCKPELSS
jgi:cbb3-type cytochrome oxidase maturation protein